METPFFMKAHFRKKSLLVITTIFVVISFGLSAGVLVMSPMLFDAPGSEDIFFIYMIIIAAAFYPVIAIYGIVRGWKTFKRTSLLWPSLGWMLIIIPYIIIIVIIGAIALSKNNQPSISFIQYLV